MSKIFHVNERAFLNLQSSLRAYIIAYVEDTTPYPACCDEYREGGQMALRIADCHEEISLYFDLSSARERENSLHKAKTLADILSRFRDAIEAETKAIEERGTVQQHTRAAAAVH
ncbi:MAG: hypothetical protein ABJB34_09475 [Acidobacteriota bacterium]